MTTDKTTNYYGDLTVTTTINVGHPNYVGKHVRNLKIGNVVLFFVSLVAAIVGTTKLTILPFLLIAGLGILFYFNYKRINNIKEDLDSEPQEIEGIVEKEGQAVKPGRYPYPGGFVILEGFEELFRTDTTFVRRIKVGQKVRLLYTPKLRFVKAWQVMQ